MKSLASWLIFMKDAMSTTRRLGTRHHSNEGGKGKTDNRAGMSITSGCMISANKLLGVDWLEGGRGCTTGGDVERRL